jgi:GNAT superfamily N-acetyltransferase
MNSFRIERAAETDLSLILSFIRQLAEYERLSDAVTANEAVLRESLFGVLPSAEVIIGYDDARPVGFAVFFQSFSTFLGKPGIYLEDLFVVPEARGRGFGRAMLVYLAKLANDRGYGRLEWSVLDWNEPAINFYGSLGAVPLDDWTMFRVSGEGLKRLADGNT